MPTGLYYKFKLKKLILSHNLTYIRLISLSFESVKFAGADKDADGESVSDNTLNNIQTSPPHSPEPSSVVIQNNDQFYIDVPGINNQLNQ